MHLLHKNFTTIKIILMEFVLIITIAFFNVLVRLYLSLLLLTSAAFYIGFLPKYKYLLKDHPYLKVENREICFKNIKFGVLGFFGPSEHNVVKKHWN
jgi:hypothetical protein